MNRRKLLISLATAGALSAGLSSSILSASASQGTISVQLVTGQTISRTVEAGTPCTLGALGPLPAPAAGPVVCNIPPVEALPTPTQTQPPTQSDPGTGTQPTPTSPTTPTTPDANGQPGRAPKDGGAGGNAQAPAGTTIGSTTVDGLAPEQQRTRKNFRAPDGAPTTSDPTFSLSLPSPAPIGVPNFFIDKFRIPPFLLPIYQAAGTQYGVPWQVLAAINEIETDYGRNLSVSSAGALGWMQFIPSSWKMYGVDANGDGLKDPYNPVDAIFAAGRYLKAAGSAKDLRRAIFAYNHATWYVDSVMLRAKLIGGMPPALVDSLTTLTQGHFPVAAKATYAQSLSKRAGKRRVHSGNAAVVVQGSTSRGAIDIFSRDNAPVIAVNDSVVSKVGVSRKLGRYVVLQDVAGNRYEYAHLGRVAATVPQPKPVSLSARSIQSDLEQAPADDKPAQPASAGAPPRPVVKPASGKAPAPKAGKAKVKAVAVPAAPTVAKERLFAHPTRPRAARAGGDQQLLATGKPLAGFKTFEAYFNDVLGLKGKDVVLKKLRPGVQIVAGTIIGRINQLHGGRAPHISFAVTPTGAKVPVDTKVLLDGWNLLASTAIYRAAGKSAFFGANSKNATIGQLLLMPKEALGRRVLVDPRVKIYSCGRRDIRAGQIDRRVLLAIEYLASSGLNPTISSLTCGHGFLTTSGNVSEHSSGNAVDIAAINGIPILGHQGKGSITDIAIRRLALLQGNARPHQIISLETIAGLDNTLSLPDHANHIHVGFRPLYGSSPGAARQYNATLKPEQWIKLINRLSQIDNPVVPVKPSKYSIKVAKKSTGQLRQGD